MLLNTSRSDDGKHEIKLAGRKTYPQIPTSSKYYKTFVSRSDESVSASSFVFEEDAARKSEIENTNVKFEDLGVSDVKVLFQYRHEATRSDNANFTWETQDKAAPRRKRRFWQKMCCIWKK